MNTPHISIALCTYKGSKYIQEQLESIRNQSLQPSEIIICDDSSPDSTLEIINAFEAPFPIKVYVNSPALGTIKNFEKAITLCEGDLIFLCDQDDFWPSNKLEVMANYLQENPQTMVLFSNALLVDEHLNSLNDNLWEKVRFRQQQQEQWRAGASFDILLEGNRVTGCALAIRKVFVSQVLPFPAHISNKFIHDAWIALVASITNSIDFINENLVWYRQHPLQQVGTRAQLPPKKITLKDRLTRPQSEKTAPFREKAAYYKSILDYINAHFSYTPEQLAPLIRAYNHYNLRAELPSNRLKRIIPVVKNYLKGNYHHYLDIEANKYGIYLAILGDLLE